MRKPAGKATPLARGASPGRLLGWIKDNAEVIKIALAMIAGIFAFVEYRSKDYVERVKNSADVIEKFQGSEDNAALKRLDALRWSASYTSKLELLSRGELTSQEFRSVVADEVRDKHLEDVLKSVRGLKSVSICAIQGRCEPLSICMNLSQIMQDLRCDFRETIAELSMTNGSCIIDEINFVLDTYCNNWVAAYLGLKSYKTIEDNLCLYDKQEKKSTIGQFCMKSTIYKRPASFWNRLTD